MNQKNLYGSIYLDEGANYYEVYDNVIENTPMSFLTKHGRNYLHDNYYNQSYLQNQVGLWKEEGSDVLHEEKIRLEKSCDEEGVHVLQAQLRKNAIFHAKVRISEQGFELLELIENDCSEPQLEALRGADAPQADVRMSEEEEAEVAEGRCRIQTFAKARTKVYFEGKQEEGIRILHAMQKRQVGWYNDAVNYAADRAVPKFNAALPNGEKKLTKKAFREQVRLQKIVISDNERFVFWLDATDLVKDAVIGVSGSLQGGIDGAQLQQEESR